MIAVDTNILVYAHRVDSSFHKKADKVLTALAEGPDLWAIAWPCIHEFLAIVTHPRIYKPPTPLEDAIKQVLCWMESPALTLIGENEDYWTSLQTILKKGMIRGPQIHDARVATLCLIHHVKILWSADRDYSRFDLDPLISIENPLIEAV